MFKSFLLSLLFAASLLAQTNVMNIIGGGNSESSDGSGNINGVGSAAAVYHPRALAKSGDNQLIVGDGYGIKKVDIDTNTISTLLAFNDSTSVVYDIVVDSSSNIYAAVSIWTANDGVGCTATGNFHDQRIYKLSSTGSILTTWGSSNCETTPNDNFSSHVSLTIDENDGVYAVPAYTPDANGASLGTQHKNIEKLNNDGTFSLFYDLKTLNPDIGGVYAIEYYKNEFYLAVTAPFQLLRLNAAKNTLTTVYTLSNASTGIEDISFDKNGDIYLATGDYIRKVFQHGTTYISSHILGNEWNYFQPTYNIKDDILYTEVDSLNVSGFQLYSAIMIDDNLFVTDNYNHRIAKVSFPSNALPTMHFKDFPTEVKKNVNTYFGIDVNDTDGFVSKVYCDFGNGSGEQEVFHDNYGGSQSSSGSAYIKYITDGNYNISCTIYDNEGAQASFSKSLTVGDTCANFSVEKDQQHVAMKVGDTQYFNIQVCEPVQIFSSDESIATATRSKTEYVDEVEVKAISEGNATITVSDKHSAGYLFVNITEANATTPVITTSDKNQTIGNITFLENEPEGYFSWSEANNFCKALGLRLPSMDELIYVWNFNDKVKSPLGFQKDTFYWASEIEADSDSHQACAMDADCSQKDSWPNSSNGHPKCVVAVNGSLEINNESNLIQFETTNEGNTKKVDIDLGDKKIAIVVPQLSDIFDNGDNGVTVTTPIKDTFDTRTTINNNGTLESEFNRLVNGIAERTQVLIDFVVNNSTINSDGSSVITMILGNLNLNIKTNSVAQVTSDYTINGKITTMPTFNSGSKVHVKNSGNDVVIEVQTKLTSTLRF